MSSGTLLVVVNSEQCLSIYPAYSLFTGRFRDIAFDGPKSQYSATPLVFSSPDGGVPLGRSP